MEIEKKIYESTKQASLFDYSIFNRDKDIEKTEFLNKLNSAIKNSEWFDINSFKHLKDRNFPHNFTKVPKVDDETQKEESETLNKIFTREEIETLIRIIKNLNSHGVLAIKELRDDYNSTNKKESIFKRIFS